MKIFNVAQIKNWDSYTISHEPIDSINLMERAGSACVDWLIENMNTKSCFRIFCGKGNNGGDGLVIARHLFEMKINISVYILYSEKPGSFEFETNLHRLQNTSVAINFCKTKEDFPQLVKTDIIVDALFGTGLNKKLTGFYSELVHHINSLGCEIVSIDVPSGLFIEKSSLGNEIIRANATLTFQNQKLAFLIPENAAFIGKVFLLDIGLSKEYEDKEKSLLEWIDQEMINHIYQPRNQFSNKGDFGFASIVAGSYGMMGAAVLSAKSCLRSGVGKLTIYTCEAGYEIIQTAVPEAMCRTAGKYFIEELGDITKFNVIGIGPGIGKYPTHKNVLEKLFKSFAKPVVIDADALNILSENKSLYSSIPANSILTPHPKEFERLFGDAANDFDRIDVALSKARELQLFIILKGHFTFIAAPDGKGYFNSTGNPGMATAGSGDVLTGIITGLLAQKYSPLNAGLLGVYLHGLAGDIAAGNLSEESLIAGDIIDYLGEGFKKIRGEKNKSKFQSE